MMTCWTKEVTSFDYSGTGSNSASCLKG